MRSDEEQSTESWRTMPFPFCKRWFSVADGDTIAPHDPIISAAPVNTAGGYGIVKCAQLRPHNSEHNAYF